MQRAGVFIVIEGTDGSGKSTQFDLLQKHLEDAGHDVAVFKFPRYDHPSSYFVKRYLDGAYGNADDVGPYTSSLFYALDRYEAAPEIRQALADGKVVLCDRFSGSNMAHQGTKIPNAEQRRGFFIWLDNLEFEMLRLPRPDISFVLRVPADISRQLLADKENRDIHETDLNHLERAITVYDDMTQLFPKDFQRVDCVRSGKLLDIETVSSLLWEKVSPLLPAKPEKKAPASTQTKPAAAEAAQPAQISTEEKTEQEQEAQETKAPAKELVIQNASGLLVQKIERLAGSVTVEFDDTPSVYTPDNLIPKAKKDYTSKTESVLKLYSKLVAGLAERGVDPKEAQKSAWPALPVAIKATVKIDTANPRLEDLIINLINDSLPEAQTAGASLFAQAVKAGASQFKSSGKPAKRTAPNTIGSIADEYLAENHIGEQPAVQLESVWPRNETELAADMLYEHTSLPLRVIQDRIQSWPMNRKLDIMEAYVGDPQPGPVLEKAHYSWDLQAPYGTFCELQRRPAETLEIQTLTPRYGFDVPEIIDEAGLSDTFEKCFDTSLELYSALQKAGHPLEAQYAVLHGHNQRWKMTLNAAQMIDASRQTGWSPDAQKLLSQMREKLAEAHPIIGEAQYNR